MSDFVLYKEKKYGNFGYVMVMIWLKVKYLGIVINDSQCGRNLWMICFCGNVLD